MDVSNTRHLYSIVVPVFNEVGNIKDTFKQLKNLPAVLGLKPEIIFVDDGSNDGSAELLDGLAREDPDVVVIHNQANRGYGAALKSGIAASRTNVIAMTDADSTYPNGCIPEMVAEIGRFDMVVASRTGKNVRIPGLRKPAKKILAWLANYLSGYRIPDLNSGLRVIKKEALQRFMNILPNGFSFTSTITIAMLTNGYTVKYMPIDYFQRKGKSKIHPVKDTLNFLQLIIKTVMYFEPLKVFLPLSFILFLSGLGVFTFSYFFLEKILDTTTAILFTGGIQMLAIGMLADLIVKRGKP